MIKKEELSSTDAAKERYERPLLVRHGPLRNVTGVISPIGVPGDGQDGGLDD